ncbi:acyl-CoA thioester hydrolase/BAAT C-terminal domain-containing protein [Cellulomonas sp. MW4]|uniref:Acyl-CoA thioester hydrolase/BAAT C-terminal domain-containing protein n=1 Tax=Cellulomonas alba TaxID=3053467 RepID=A0ABT7SC57_9CELL|nr:acyl-CoA thioester hydrolase/BAAT C-terminal domain-containing protein [Cellulomonas alba]
MRRRTRRSETQKQVERHLGEVYRVIAATAVGVILLAILGASLGPDWDPQPLTDPLQVETDSTAIGGAPTLGSYATVQRDVPVHLDGATITARLTVPQGTAGAVPGIVFLHGAGTGSHETAFREQVAALSRAGVATLVPDKRLDTYTTRDRDYVTMAADYERSVEYLRTVPGVDPARVGIYAESEGAWIGPVMAAKDRRLAFVVLASAPVVPPREQAAFAVDSYLRNTGVPKGVFRAIPRAVGMSIPGGGFEYADFDVTPWQRKMTQPVLVVYGTADASMPIVQGAEQILRDTAIAGNGQVTVRYYAGANHGLHLGSMEGPMSPDFLRDLPGWVLGLPATATAPPRIAGDQPFQEFVAAPVPQPRWLRSGNLVFGGVLGAVGVLVLAGLALGLTRLWEVVHARARAHRPGEPYEHVRYGRGVAWRLAAVGGGAVVTVVALLWYLVAIARLALDYQRNGVVVQGGWVLVRLLGIGAVVAAVLLLRRVRLLAAADEAVARGVVRVTALWAVVLASAVLLVVLAYWGVYQLGI